MKKILLVSQLAKYFGKNSPQLKKLGVVAAIAVAALFGLGAMLAVGLIVLLFELFSNTNISLDINQLVGQFSAWISGLFGAGQEALEKAPVQIEVNQQ